MDRAHTRGNLAKCRSGNQDYVGAMATTQTWLTINDGMRVSSGVCIRLDTDDVCKAWTASSLAALALAGAPEVAHDVIHDTDLHGAFLDNEELAANLSLPRTRSHIIITMTCHDITTSRPRLKLKNPPLSGSRCAGYPPGMVPGMQNKCRISPHWGRSLLVRAAQGHRASSSRSGVGGGGHGMAPAPPRSCLGGM